MCSNEIPYEEQEKIDNPFSIEDYIRLSTLPLYNIHSSDNYSINFAEVTEPIHLDSKTTLEKGNKIIFIEVYWNRETSSPIKTNPFLFASAVNNAIGKVRNYLESQDDLNNYYIMVITTREIAQRISNRSKMNFIKIDAEVRKNAQSRSSIIGRIRSNHQVNLMVLNHRLNKNRYLGWINAKIFIEYKKM